MAGLYEIWRDPTRDDDDPERFQLDLHGADHHRRGRGRPHPRPDAAAGRARAVRRLARPDGLRPRRAHAACWCPPRPAGSRPTRCRTLVNNVRNNGPELLEPLPPSRAVPHDRRLDRRRPRTATPACTPTARGTRSRRCCSGTAPAAASTRRDLVALAAELPRNGISRGPRRAALAGRRQEDRAAAPAVLDECFVAAADKLRVRTPLVVGGRCAGARSRGPHGPRARRVGRARPGVPAAPARPAGAVAARRAAGGAGADAGGPGRARRLRRPEEFPPDRELTVVPGGRPRLQGAPARGR